MSRRASETLFLTDGEIATKIGVSFERWEAAAKMLVGKGLPAPDPVFDNRRYWPAVKAYLDRRAGIGKNMFPGTTDGEENWDGKHGQRRLTRAGT